MDYLANIVKTSLTIIVQSVNINVRDEYSVSQNESPVSCSLPNGLIYLFPKDF